MKRILTIIFLVFVQFFNAQDLHFSQAFNSPLSTNPANTGFLPDADFRVGVNFRNQWAAIISQPYKTQSAFADVQVARNTLGSSWFGLGVLLLNDVAGTNSLKSTKGYLSLAYHKELGIASLLSAGVNVGFAGKSIDPSALKFPDQFNGKFFDAQLPTTVVLNNTATNYIDMQVGLNYAYFPNENIYFNGGISAHHINRPKETFFLYDVNDDIYGQRIPIRYIGFLNGMFKTSDKIILQPFIFYTTQARTSNLIAGATANYNISENGSAQLIGGLHYRLNDAIIPMAGLEFKNTRLMYNYDVTMSNLRNYNNFRGAHEISLIYKGFFKSNDRPLQCPSFKF